MTDKVLVVGWQDGHEVSVEVSVPEPIDFLEFREMIKGMDEFRDTKIMDIVDGRDHHFCEYCGSVASGSNDDILCDDCYELFGHRKFSEL